jgi:hypothetical protein
MRPTADAKAEMCVDAYRSGLVAAKGFLGRYSHAVDFFQEIEVARARHERNNPKCPKCKRRYAEKFHKPHNQKLSYRCVGVAVNPGCGHVWEAKQLPRLDPQTELRG